MLSSESKMSEVPIAPTVLLTGASSYVGGRLISLLEQHPVVFRCLARKPDKLRPLVKKSTKIFFRSGSSLTCGLHEYATTIAVTGASYRNAEFFRGVK